MLFREKSVIQLTIKIHFHSWRVETVSFDPPSQSCFFLLRPERFPPYPSLFLYRASPVSISQLQGVGSVLRFPPLDDFCRRRSIRFPTPASLAFSSAVTPERTPKTSSSNIVKLSGRQVSLFSPPSFVFLLIGQIQDGHVSAASRFFSRPFLRDLGFQYSPSFGSCATPSPKKSSLPSSNLPPLLSLPIIRIGDWIGTPQVPR